MTTSEAEKEYFHAGVFCFWRYTTDKENMWNLIPQENRKRVFREIYGKMYWQYEDTTCTETQCSYNEPGACGNICHHIKLCEVTRRDDKFYYVDDPDQIPHDKVPKYNQYMSGLISMYELHRSPQFEEFLKGYTS